MRNLYEIGPIYIWQNQVGEYAHINGSECKVVAPVSVWGKRRKPRLAQETDTPIKCKDGIWSTMMAEPGDLRRKEFPPGELLIKALFKLRTPEIV